MDIQAVRTEITALLATITGLRAYDFAAGSVQSPSVLVGEPLSIDYGQTYARGLTMLQDLPALVLVGKASDRTAAKRLGAYVAESGAQSVPAKVESRTGSWVACDVVTCMSVDFPEVDVAGIAYLGAQFHLQVAGRGV